ncbi:TRAP transporter small permease subunit [Candidatus Atribacteria bacterium 1244-E10-H5-B2]|nr:MAG: TRAP transporter small permease subunit [Candidatus Atribacteria bacterium 1244-E10-H5-B2]
MKKNNAFLSVYKIFLQLINGFEDWGSIIAFIIMVGLVNLAILLRITMNFESSEWEEIARFTSIWMYMLAIAIAARENSHIRAGFIDNLIKSFKTKLILKILFNSISLSCIVVFTYWSIIQLKWIIGTKQVSLVLMMDMWVVYLSFVVGGILAAIHNLIHLIKFINNLKNLKEINLNE